MVGRGSDHHSFRLPVGPASPPKHPCARNAAPREHGDGIRFQLVRYGRPVGTIVLCGNCFAELNGPGPVDPLHVDEDAA